MDVDDELWWAFSVLAFLASFCVVKFGLSLPADRDRWIGSFWICAICGVFALFASCKLCSK